MHPRQHRYGRWAEGGLRRDFHLFPKFGRVKCICLASVSYLFPRKGEQNSPGPMWRADGPPVQAIGVYTLTEKKRRLRVTEGVDIEELA